ncbi:MAG TPA: SdpI family protein [Candidatus Polarisedimenticolia bacterium]|nr:SdpI family protein [Candidatus Polarisedimenticolia bacterium]
MRKVPMNRWFGTRLPASYVSEANWYAMNRYGAIQMLWYGGAFVLVGLAALLFPPRVGSAWFIAALAAPAVLTVPMLLRVVAYSKRLPK